MPTASAPQALFAGLCTLDIIHLVDHVPAPNEKTVAIDSLLAAGGPATNAAVSFVHQGGSATVVTRLPQHVLTDVIVADLEACGVGVQAHSAGSGPPVTASIMVTQATGERAVVSASASAELPSPEPSPPGTLPSLKQVRAVLVDGYHRDISLPLAVAARDRGIPVIMDAGSLKPHTAQVAQTADLVVASADLATPSGDHAPHAVFAWLASLGVERAVITRGDQPILWRTPAGSGRIEVPHTPVVDTLGAGDFFHGALTWRIASLGMADARLPNDLAWAATAVAPSLASFGTREWLRG